ncbi:MAG: hypothetical protein KGI06_02440 [Candidatus Micrarchaeota archaeon]|nr:hypothetical protein [Candidatus Micrarchaeota archaeon]
MMFPLALIARVMLLASIPTAESQLLPLAVTALMVDALIVAVWYLIGSMLNNSRIKGAALSEYYQFIGTVILIAIVIGSLGVISSAFYSVYSASKLMSPTAISTLCNNIKSTSQLDIIGKGKDSLLAGAQSSSGQQFTGICDLVNVQGGSTLTEKLEYPISAVTVILANMTNQTAANLNYSFTIDAWLGFLSHLSPTIALCIDKPPVAEACQVPIPGDSALFFLRVQFTPYAGYSLIVSNMSLLGSLLNLSMDSFIVQLLFITIFLYTWPWLLFGGIVLRSTIFTRRLGGMLIAVAIAAMFIYPAVFSIEYMTLGNGISVAQTSGQPGGLNTTYGFNAITALPATPAPPWPKVGTPATGNYVINFFVEPNIKAITFANGCWPASQGLLTTTGLVTGNIFSTSVLGLPKGTPMNLVSAESADIAGLMIPFSSILSAINYITSFALGSPNSQFPIDAYCAPQAALNTLFSMLDAYGIIGITSYLLPLINIILTITSIQGISELLGGDTSLAGLARIL